MNSSRTVSVPQAELDRQAAIMQELRAENDRATLEEGTPRKACFLTFGCQQNEADTELLAGMACQMGYALTEQPEDADLILLNTCAIREHAEQKAFSTVGQYQSLKKKRPHLLIGMCGCMVTQEHRQDALRQKFPYVDFSFCTSSLYRFPEILRETIRSGKRQNLGVEDYRIVEGLPVHRSSRYKAWVSIMYGCNNFCSYCIVPYVRGRERSRAPEKIRAEVASLIAEGYRDITLLGQNVNSYGKDLNVPLDFADLLQDLASIPGNYRLHFMTSHPKDASDKLLDVMAASPRIAKHFHLPLQSGSDAVLKAMNRHYDLKQYLHIADGIRQRMPSAAITTDLIVGFPGETEEDFEGTLEIMRRVRFDQIYSFQYSPRKGTPAATMEQIPQEIKSERYTRLIALQNELALSINDAYVGKDVIVLCEGPSKGNADLLAGRSEQSKMVFFTPPAGKELPEGTFAQVHITRADPYALYGEFLRDAE